MGADSPPGIAAIVSGAVLGEGLSVLPGPRRDFLPADETAHGLGQPVELSCQARPAGVGGQVPQCRHVDVAQVELA